VRWGPNARSGQVGPCFFWFFLQQGKKNVRQEKEGTLTRKACHPEIFKSEILNSKILQGTTFEHVWSAINVN
jgi:hypothetical protein